MSAEEHYKNMKISKGGIIAPIVTVALLVVFWRLGQKWLAIPVVALFLFMVLALPSIVRRKARRFHRDALTLLAQGKAEAVVELARKQFLLQIFAPSSPIDAKLGLAYTQLGDFEAAANCLENAVPDAPESEQPALQAALTKAFLVLGYAGRAEITGKSLISRGIELADVLALTARARLATGRADEDTYEYLDKAASLSPSKEVALMVELTRIEAALQTGKKAPEIPEGADSEQRFLRVWIHYVRGALREKRGDVEKAVESYGRAVKEAKSRRSVFLDMAHRRLEKLAPQSLSKHGTTEPDDLPARRRRKRR